MVSLRVIITCSARLWALKSILDFAFSWHRRHRPVVRYRQEVHPGEQGAIVDPSTWQQVQALLEAQRLTPRIGQVH
jgi:hypothetical protein